MTKEEILAQIALAPIGHVALQKMTPRQIAPTLRELAEAGLIKKVKVCRLRLWVLADWTKPVPRKKPVPLLATIKAGPPRTSRELADHLGIGKSNVLRRINKLRAQKLVRQQLLGGELRYVPIDFELSYEQLLASVLERTEEEGDCAIWQQAKESDTGNPLMRHKDKIQRVQNVLWDAAGKTRPEGKTLIMSCRNKNCVLPEHTKQVPRAVPFQLAGKEGKFSSLIKCRKVAETLRQLRGKFKPEDVEMIRNSELSNGELAALFNCNKSCVGQVRRGETYKTYRATPFSGLGSLKSTSSA